jgi:hypothetical protein
MDNQHTRRASVARRLERRECAWGQQENRRGPPRAKRSGDADPGSRWDLGCGQLAVEAAKDRDDRATVAERQLQASAGGNRTRGDLRRLLHHGAQAAAFGQSPRWGIGAEQTVLPAPTQDVVGQHGAGQDQGIGGEFPRGQARDVQIGLEYATRTSRARKRG